jgi:hypothetical protein
MPSRSSSRAPSTSRTQVPGSRASSSSGYSKGDSRRHYEANMNFYGPTADAHRALSLGRQGAKHVTVHHARYDPNRDQDQFFYEEANRHRISLSQTGRSQVARLSSRERTAAEARLREYGEDDRNLPRISSGTNCHNFAAGAVGVLEDD